MQIRSVDTLLWSGEVDQVDQAVEVPVRLEPGRTSLEFESADPPVQASWQDKRMILFRVNHLEIRLLREAPTKE